MHKFQGLGHGHLAVGGGAVSLAGIKYKVLKKIKTAQGCTKVIESTRMTQISSNPSEVLAVPW